jgi:hypothetical protein
MANFLSVPKAPALSPISTGNWMKYQKAGNTSSSKLATSGSGMADAAVMTSGIGNMLGDISTILEKYEQKKAINDLAATDPSDPEYYAKLRKGLSAAGGSQGLLLAMQYEQTAKANKAKMEAESQKQKQAQSNFQTEQEGKLATSPNVRPAQVEPNPAQGPTPTGETLGETLPPVVEKGAFKVGNLPGDYVKTDKSKGLETKPISQADFAYKFSESSPKDSRAQEMTVNVDGKLEKKWGIPFSAVNLGERQRQFGENKEQGLDAKIATVTAKPLEAISSWGRTEELLSKKDIPNDQMAIKNIARAAEGGGSRLSDFDVQFIMPNTSKGLTAKTVSSIFNKADTMEGTLPDSFRSSFVGSNFIKVRKS